MVAVYEDGKRAGGKRSLSDASAASRDPRAVVWISLVGPSREELDSVARQFELQELAQEDSETRKGVILKFQGRGLTFMVSPARYLDDSGTVEIGELDVLLEEGLAITVLRGEGPNFHDVEQGLEEGSYLSRLGSVAILRALLHRVLDDYVSVVDGLGDDLAGLEDDVLEGNGRVTNRLYEFSREVEAGINLDELGADDVHLAGRRVTLDLPEAHVLDSSLDEDKTRVYDWDRGLLVKGDYALVEEAPREALDEIEVVARDEDIVGQAQKNAEDSLREFLTSLGYKWVVFKCSY
jgi:Protein of unknown function (DUF4230)/CorA-like Mg2+ transporter protein